MRNLSIKGILIGSLLDVCVSFVLGVILGMSILGGLHRQHMPAAEEHAAFVSAVHDAKWIYLWFGLMSSALGGYVAARIAGRQALLHGALSSVFCLALGVFTMARGASIYPLWAQFVIMFASIGCACAGGYLWFIHSRAKRPQAV